ncbi:hypothetical protein V565_111810 [Rhizoctonia solani 123E]|uniref:Uncharacterized protein n=1 Tax=Rhizoctonia solani 123E TaxID=1423351 RepID=A0A074RUE1_9AGAM|nr:hypothetical protein V565_111810 [Rhizoctonia solani 123E]
MLEPEPSDSEKATQVSLSPTRPSTATVSITTPTACLESPRSPGTTLSPTTSSTEAPTIETAGASANVVSDSTSSILPNTPTEPSTTESITKTPAPKSPATVAPTHPTETPTKPQNAVLLSVKATTGASSPASESTSTGKPSAVASIQPNKGDRPPPVAAQQAPVPTIIQTTNRSSPMPKPTTSPSTADNSSSAATTQETATSSTVNNVALQSAQTKMTVQTAARPIPSLPPAVPVFGRSSMVAPTIEHPGHTTATSVVSHPAGPLAVSQRPSVKASTAITPSIPGQPRNVMSSAPEPTPKAPRSEYSTIPGLPPSTQAALASSCSLSSNPSSQPACQTPTASQNGKDKIGPPAGTSNKRQHDDTNGKSNESFETGVFMRN